MPKKKRTKKENGLVNFADVVEEAFGGASGGLQPPLLWVGFDPIDIRLFTPEMAPVETHWYSVDGTRRQFLCNGQPCAFCLAKVNVTRVLLLPVLDAVEREIAILPIPRDYKAGGLMDAIRPFMGKDAKDGLLEIARTRSRRYQVTPLSTDDDTDQGDDIIKSFLARTKDMDEDELASCYRSVFSSSSNQELLRDHPKLATRIRHRYQDLDLETL